MAKLAGPNRCQGARCVCRSATATEVHPPQINVEADGDCFWCCLLTCRHLVDWTNTHKIQGKPPNLLHGQQQNRSNIICSSGWWNKRESRTRAVWESGSKGCSEQHWLSVALRKKCLVMNRWLGICSMSFRNTAQVWSSAVPRDVMSRSHVVLTSIREFHFVFCAVWQFKSCSNISVVRERRHRETNIRGEICEDKV